MKHKKLEQVKEHKHKFEYIGLSNFRLVGSPYLYQCKCGIEKWGEELTQDEK